jgi:galactose mutarotase-like enzyme
MENGENVILKNKNWKLEIDLNGGRIVELEYNNKTILGTFARIDGKIGNAHVCVPNFGYEGIEEYKMPFHGPARSKLWEIKENDKKGAIIIFCNLENFEKYPGKLYVEQEFILNDGLKQIVRVKNIGKDEAPVNVAIHNYFNAPNGWENLKINGVKVENIVKADDYIFTKKENEVLITGLKPMSLILNGMNWIRLWTARKQYDGQILYDQEYVCIEPTVGRGDYFGSEESLLRPGETREV